MIGVVSIIIIDIAGTARDGSKVVYWPGIEPVPPTPQLNTNHWVTGHEISGFLVLLTFGWEKVQ